MARDIKAQGSVKTTDSKTCTKMKGVWNPNTGECVIRTRGKKNFTRNEVWKVLSEVEGDVTRLAPEYTRKISMYFHNFEL